MVSGAMDLGVLPSAPPGRTAPRPGTETVPAGYHDAFLAVPPAAAEGPVPLLVFLHGSGGTAQQSLDLVGAVAERRGVAVLAPRSTRYTWDVVLGRPGPDVAALQRALAAVVATLDVDADAVGVGGFSDGASYALSLGLASPASVRAVLAFSPGFVVDGEPPPGPRCFVSHGTRDQVLPIERTSRRLVPRLRQEGHEVEYREFDGLHEVPADVLEGAFDWWLGPRPGSAAGR